METKEQGLSRSRFNKKAKKETQLFVASIPFDYRLYSEDIQGSIAHIEMLANQGIVTKNEAQQIVRGLLSIKEEIKNNKFDFSIELEDIHMNIEYRLREKIGDVAMKLHTARSRNDQIALDLRLFVKDTILKLIEDIKHLQRELVKKAEENIQVIMPGYTHLQHAQPVLFAHYLLAYFEMFQRDIERLNDCYIRTDALPLGSGALAGVPYPIDRKLVANKLGFSSVSNNSIDTVSDRDFILEFEFDSSLCMVHLSRLAEELILWSSSEFGFIDIDEAYCTSSSIMPQKKNADILELIRGKTGRVIGGLLSLLIIMKGLALSYNRDMQEDKIPLFDITDTLSQSLKLSSAIISTMTINKERMLQSAIQDYTLATDLADYLVIKGIAFRKAHNIVGQIVKYALKKGKQLNNLTLDEYRQYSSLFNKDVYNITLEKSVSSRESYGGTSPKRVMENIKRIKKILFPNGQK